MTLLHSLLSWIRRRILRDRRARWNHQYSEGRWENLKQPEEDARFAAVADFLRQYARSGRVLEIGCGEALLQRRMGSMPFERWVGVDVSDVAIARAQAYASETVQYVAADMVTYQPDGAFDAILFTESIYYVPACDRLLERYAQFLAPGGVFIISIFSDGRSERVWREIHANTERVEGTTVVNERGTWISEVLKPRAPSR